MKKQLVKLMVISFFAVQIAGCNNSPREDSYEETNNADTNTPINPDRDLNNNTATEGSDFSTDTTMNQMNVDSNQSHQHKYDRER